MTTVITLTNVRREIRAPTLPVGSIAFPTTRVTSTAPSIARGWGEIATEGCLGDPEAPISGHGSDRSSPVTISGVPRPLSVGGRVDCVGFTDEDEGLRMGVDTSRAREGRCLRS
jgi:hypothetical protein